METASPAQSRDFQVVVLSGPSGSGKSTLVNRIVAESPVKLVKAISATTRPPRPGEVNGQDYHFLTPEEFEQRRDAGETLECAEVHGQGYWYGTLNSELRRAKDAGAWCLLEIDVQGALKVMQEYPEALTIFVESPSEEEYERRLRRRGTESDEVIARRLRTARSELERADRYSYRVVNDDLDRAVGEILGILQKRERELHAR